MYRMPTVPQDIGGVLDTAFALFKAGWRGAFALAVAAGVASSAYRLFDDTLERLLAGDLPRLSGWGAALLVAGSLVSLYLYLGAIARLAALAAERPISAREALRRALRRYLSMLLCVGAAAAVGVAAGTAVFLSVLAFLPAAVAAMVVFIYWYFAGCLVITRNIGGVAALRGSFVLVRGHWWRTVATLTVGYCITLVATVLIGVVAAALGAAAGLVDVSPDALVFVVEAAGTGITMPFMIAVSLAALRDLELRRGGTDLAARIDAAAP